MNKFIEELIREVEGRGIYSDFPQEEAVKKLLEDTGFKVPFLKIYK